jgi:hypothetical protein
MIYVSIIVVLFGDHDVIFVDQVSHAIPILRLSGKPVSRYGCDIQAHPAKQVHVEGAILLPLSRQAAMHGAQFVDQTALPRSCRLARGKDDRYCASF